MDQTAPAALPSALLLALDEAGTAAEPATRAVNTWAARADCSRTELRAVLDAAALLLQDRCTGPVLRVGLRLHPAVRLRYR